MSGASTTLPFERALPSGATPADRGTRGTVWTQPDDTCFDETRRPGSVHGCAVVRNLTDDRGRDWRVRQLWSEHCHGLLFQCAVPGVRSEIRPIRGPLESLTDDELLTLLPADD